RGEGGDVAAQVARLAVGAHDHRHGVPADDRADAPLQLRVARALGLLVRRDGVDVLGGGRERKERAGAAGQLDHVLQQCMRTLRAVTVDHRLERFDPLAGLYRIRIVVQHIVQPVHITPIAARGGPRRDVLVDPGVYRTGGTGRFATGAYVRWDRLFHRCELRGGDRPPDRNKARLAARLADSLRCYQWRPRLTGLLPGDALHAHRIAAGAGFVASQKTPANDRVWGRGTTYLYGVATDGPDPGQIDGRWPCRAGDAEARLIQRRCGCRRTHACRVAPAPGG